MYTVSRKNGKNNNLTTLEQHFNYILEKFNFDFFNTDTGFGIQLFDKDDFAKDKIEPLIEFEGSSISDAVSQAIKWINEQPQMEHVYQCMSGFSVDMYDDNERLVENEQKRIPINSVWTLQNSFSSSEVRLVNKELGWLKISLETLEAYFMEI